MDPERERIRLAELYAGMADGELEALAEDWDSLTDAAHQALKDEMARRGLSIAMEEAPPTADDTQLREPVTVAEFHDPAEALLAKGLLESGGIQCALSDVGDKRLDPDGFIARSTAGIGHIPDVAGVIKLQVNAADLEAAFEALNQPAPEDSESEG
jgi:hypothetical protein